MAEIKVPFTLEQVEAITTYQKEHWMHPFTCPNRHDHPYEEEYKDKGVLRVRTTGFYCLYCDYTQDWAHHFMTQPKPEGIKILERLLDKTGKRQEE